MDLHKVTIHYDALASINIAEQEGILTVHTLMDCFANYPPIQEGFVLDFPTIRKYQEKSESMKRKVQKNKRMYKLQNFHGVNLVMMIKNKENKEDKIYIPNDMLKLLVKWYHDSMAHIEGANRLQTTIQRHFYNPKLHEAVKEYVMNCDECQRYKRGSTQYGYLSAQETP